MKKSIIYIGLIFTLASCTKKNHESIIGNEVYNEIDQRFGSIDISLNSQIDNHFYDGVKRLIQFDNYDSLKSIQEFYNYIGAAGYPDSFFIDFENLEYLKTSEKLIELGLNDRSAYKRFCYNICYPIVSEYEKENDLLLDSAFLIKSVSNFNPDSININFALFLSSLSGSVENDYRLKNIWENKGSRKVMILVTFCLMSDKEMRNNIQQKAKNHKGI